jgi:hypothetical protein
VQSTRVLINVLCRIPELYSFKISSKKQLELTEVYSLPGNPIDVACFPGGVNIVSIDATSQTEHSDAREDAEKTDLLRLISTDQRTESESPTKKTLTQLVDSINAQGSLKLAAGAEKGVKELLYNIENLRKGLEE